MENKPQLEADGLLHFTLKEDITLNISYVKRRKKRCFLLGTVNFKWHGITSWKMILLHYNEKVRLDFFSELGLFTWCDCDCDYVVWDLVVLLQSLHMKHSHGIPHNPLPICCDNIFAVAPCEQPYILVVTFKKNYKIITTDNWKTKLLKSAQTDICKGKGQ